VARESETEGGIWAWLNRRRSEGRSRSSSGGQWPGRAPSGWLPTRCVEQRGLAAPVSAREEDDRERDWYWAPMDGPVRQSFSIVFSFSSIVVRAPDCQVGNPISVLDRSKEKKEEKIFFLRSKA
jgi:hypothetical protein